VNRKGRNDAGDWILAIIMLVVFWPVGVFLLFRLLSGNGFSGQSRKKHPYDMQRERGGYHSEYEYSYSGESLKKQQAAGSSVSKGGGTKAEQPQTDRTAGKIMTWVGAGVAALFGITAISEFLSYLSWGGLMYAWSELFVLFGFCMAGLAVMCAGLSRTRKGRRFQKYLNLIGRQKTVSVSVLSRTMGVSLRKAYDDLDEMLEKGILPMGYLDHAEGLLVLSSDGVKEPPKPQKKTAEEEVRENHAILREIREVNDRIPDPDMSAKIDRIEEITGKILEYQRKNPGKDSELRSFLEYYLPTTLKILKSYAQLDAQGIDGENIRSAKGRIEGMMDKVVEGFEKQLDRLFQAETLDITTDVEVLEQMLRKDGLSGGDGMTLGG